MFSPEVGQTIEINQVVYSFVCHPAVNQIVYGQEGITATVYKLISNGIEMGLKVFKAAYRIPYWEQLSVQLKTLADVPGLQVCNRIVITPEDHPKLIELYPEIAYAELMPWVEGTPWNSIVFETKQMPYDYCLKIARNFADSLCSLENRGVAHCDLNGSNVIISSEGKVGLVDAENMFIPGLEAPSIIDISSIGKEHVKRGPESDRINGALLIAGILGMADPLVQAWVMKYQNEDEFLLLARNEKFKYKLHNSLRQHWGEEITFLFDKVTSANSPESCPTMCRWSHALHSLFIPPNLEAFSNALHRSKHRIEDMGQSLSQILRRVEGDLQRSDRGDGVFLGKPDNSHEGSSYHGPEIRIDIDQLGRLSQGIHYQGEEINHELMKIESRLPIVNPEEQQYFLGKLYQFQQQVYEIHEIFSGSAHRRTVEIHEFVDSLCNEISTLGRTIDGSFPYPPKFNTPNIIDDDIGTVETTGGDIVGGDQNKVSVGDINNSVIVVGDSNKIQTSGTRTESKSKPEFKTTLAYPKLLSKRFSSVFLVYVYPKYISRKVSTDIDRQIADIGIEKDGYRKIVKPVEVELETLVKVKIEGPGIEFQSPTVIKITEKEVKIVFIAKPADDCVVGKHVAKLSFCDNNTSEELLSIPFEIKIVDFVFDHVSRPFIYNLAAAFSGLGAVLMFVLTFLGQVDTTFGLASGTTAGLVTATLYLRFANLYQKLRPTAGIT